MPITEQTYRVLYQGLSPKEGLALDAAETGNRITTSQAKFQLSPGFLQYNGYGIGEIKASVSRPHGDADRILGRKFIQQNGAIPDFRGQTAARRPDDTEGRYTRPCRVWNMQKTPVAMRSAELINVLY